VLYVDQVPNEVLEARRTAKKQLEDWANKLTSNPSKLKAQLATIKNRLDGISQENEKFSRRTHDNLVTMEVMVHDLLEGSEYV
jgi:chromosome segregation ATPase